MTGHINVMLVLQNCTDSLRVLPSSSRETFPSSVGTHVIGNITFEEDADVIQEHFISVNKVSDIDVKQEGIPEDISLSDIKSEPDEVSYVCICLLLDTFYQCPQMSSVFVSVFLAI
jgi:hypothetical protein